MQELLVNFHISSFRGVFQHQEIIEIPDDVKMFNVSRIAGYRSRIDKVITNALRESKKPLVLVKVNPNFANKIYVFIIMGNESIREMNTLVTVIYYYLKEFITSYITSNAWKTFNEKFPHAISVSYFHADIEMIPDDGTSPLNVGFQPLFHPLDNKLEDNYHLKECLISDIFTARVMENLSNLGIFDHEVEITTKLTQDKFGFQIFEVLLNESTYQKYSSDIIDSIIVVLESLEVKFFNSYFDDIKNRIKNKTISKIIVEEENVYHMEEMA